MLPRLPLLLVVLSTLPLSTASPQSRTTVLRDGTDTTTLGYPAPGAIIERAVARATKQDETGIELEYQSLIKTTTDSIDDKGNITKTTTTLHKRYALEEALYEELIQRNGQPLTDDEIEEELENREKFIRHVRERVSQGKKPETNDERQVRLDRALVDRFQATVVGVQEIKGEPAWVLSFEPRAGKLPERTRMDKALNRSTGKLFIAQADHGLMQIEFELQQPIRYLWGLIATLKHAAGRLEFTRVTTGIWLPHKYDLEINLRVFFRNRHQQVVREWIDRRHSEHPSDSGDILPEPDTHRH